MLRPHRTSLNIIIYIKNVSIALSVVKVKLVADYRKVTIFRHIGESVQMVNPRPRSVDECMLQLEGVLRPKEGTW
jgi:hypothetical protein